MLGQVRDPRAVEPLIRALNDPSADVRARAAVALGRLRDPRAINPLIAAMRDDKVSVRSGASAAVKKLGKRAYAPLLAAYREAHGPFRRLLMQTLAHYKTAEVSELLIAALENADRNAHLEVVHLLSRRKDRRSVEPLLEALARAKPAYERIVRASAVTGNPSGAELLERVRATETDWADVWLRLTTYIQALGEIGDAQAFDPLQDMLEIGESPFLMQVVPVVVSALRKIDNPRAVDMLHRLLEDPSYAGKMWLEKGLAGMDLMNAVGTLRQAAQGGNVRVLIEGLQHTRAAQQQLRAHLEHAADAAAEGNESEIGRAGTDLIRRLEWVLRKLGRRE